jgi:hypothetical protein
MMRARVQRSEALPFRTLRLAVRYSQTGINTGDNLRSQAPGLHRGHLDKTNMEPLRDAPLGERLVAKVPHGCQEPSWRENSVSMKSTTWPKP